MSEGGIHITYLSAVDMIATTGPATSMLLPDQIVYARRYFEEKMPEPVLKSTSRT